MPPAARSPAWCPLTSGGGGGGSGGSIPATGGQSPRGPAHPRRSRLSSRTGGERSLQPRGTALTRPRPAETRLLRRLERARAPAQRRQRHCRTAAGARPAGGDLRREGRGTADGCAAAILRRRRARSPALRTNGRTGRSEPAVPIGWCGEEWGRQAALPCVVGVSAAVMWGCSRKSRWGLWRGRELLVRSRSAGAPVGRGIPFPRPSTSAGIGRVPRKEAPPCPSGTRPASQRRCWNPALCPCTVGTASPPSAATGGRRHTSAPNAVTGLKMCAEGLAAGQDVPERS